MLVLARSPIEAIGTIYQFVERKVTRRFVYDLLVRFVPKGGKRWVSELAHYLFWGFSKRRTIYSKP